MKNIIPIIVAVLLLGTVGGVWATRSNSTSTNAAPMQGNMTIEEAKTFSNFTLYNAGNEVAGFQLNAIEKTVDADHGTTRISFLYGDCIPPMDESGHYDGGCPLPVEVDVWNACVRNPTVYNDPNSPQGERTILRGVPAQVFDNGSRLEMYTGKSAIVIYTDPKIMPLAVAAIQGVTNNVPANVELPYPAANVMEGKCA